MCYALRHCVGLSVYQSVIRRYCIDSVVGVVFADQVARRGEMQVGGCENVFPLAGIGALNNTGINRGVSPKHYTVEFCLMLPSREIVDFTLYYSDLLLDL